MWQVYAQVASDLIDDRYRQAEAVRRRHALAGNPRRAAGTPGLVRRAPAWALRGLERLAVTVARAAQSAAVRVEGPTGRRPDPVR